MHKKNNGSADVLWNADYLKAWISNFMLFFSFMLLTPLFPLYLSETFNADKQTIGFVLSGYTIAALVIRPFSGYFVDSFPRKTVLLISYFFLAVIFIGYPLAGSIVLFAIIRTLHGVPFGASTVANSTVAIDVLPSSRRAEGIGYYGLSSNLATATGPTLALLIYGMTGSYNPIFMLSIFFAAVGFMIDCTLHLPVREKVVRPPLSWDRFFLLKGWSCGLCLVCFAFSYGVLSTYIAIYGKEELGITGGTGVFFMLFAIGLIISRLTGSKALRQGRIVQNAASGILVSLAGYLLFATMHNDFGYYGAALVIGLGNGHMYPAFQTMFINLASNDRRGTANSTQLVSWDIGIGLGVLFGGMLAESAGYHAAFWGACAVNAAGMLFFFLHTRRYFLRNRLR